MRGRIGGALSSAALLTMVACGHQPKADPFGKAIAPTALSAVLEDVSVACREPLETSFTRGEKGKLCAGERDRVGRALSRRTRARFGLVDQRRVDLRGVSLIVVEAQACRNWPLRAPGYTVLTRPDAHQAGCRLSRYSGPLQVTAFEPDGTSYPGIIELVATEGVVRLSFAEADAVVRAHGFSGLDAFSSLELGRGAWAGSVNLIRLREFLGLWHFVWVVRGRGSPGLFAALHPDHPRAGDARALSIEMTLARQERDYLAVARGELSARRFLERYVWSPYRRSVAAMAGAPPVPTPQVEVQPASTVTPDPAAAEPSAP